jgi:hypothetical protein
LKEVKQVLDYHASQEEAIITYCASKMILPVHSDSSDFFGDLVRQTWLIILQSITRWHTISMFELNSSRG